jgi:hypothetical protein
MEERKKERNEKGISRSSKLGTCGLYYKPMMIVNNDARIVNKLDASLTDDAKVIIYDCHMFIVQATGVILTTFHFHYSLQMGPISKSSGWSWQAFLGKCNNGTAHLCVIPT